MNNYFGKETLFDILVTNCNIKYSSFSILFHQSKSARDSKNPQTTWYNFQHSYIQNQHKNIFILDIILLYNINKILYNIR